LNKSDFFYDLPQELIAQTPLERRDGSRMMTLSRENGTVGHRHFFDLPSMLRPGDCLVLNDSRVIPARLMGVHAQKGSAVEVLLLRDEGNGLWDCITRPGKRTRVGDEVSFGDGKLTATVESVDESSGNLRERDWPFRNLRGASERIRLGHPSSD